MLKNKVKSTDVRMFTWEVVTSFEQELNTEQLHLRFEKEFPEASKKYKPVFWKMFSFNSTVGRKHRYLVPLLPSIFLNKEKRRCLPESVFLYEMCNRKMQMVECDGNMRFAAVVGDVLFILVFVEGRLCHWSEEIGYAENYDEENLQRRLLLFDEFLQRDDYFSQRKSFALKRIPQAIFSQELFDCAVHDPFWKNLSLNKVPHLIFLKKQKYVFFVLLMVVLFCMGFFWNFFEKKEMDESIIFFAEPPELNAPILNPKFHEENFGNVASLENDTPCFLPDVKIQGLILNKLIQAEVDGIKMWLKLGDSLENYQIAEIKRDKIRLICEGRGVEVKSEKLQF